VHDGDFRRSGGKMWTRVESGLAQVARVRERRGKCEGRRLQWQRQGDGGRVFGEGRLGGRGDARD